MASNTFLSNSLCVLCHCDFGNTSLGWLSLHVNLTLAETTTSNASSNENNALLGFVSKSASSVETGRTLDSAVDRLAAPLGHSSLSEHVRESLFRLLPGFSHVMM
jgi:hypothetical protein